MAVWVQRDSVEMNEEHGHRCLDKLFTSVFSTVLPAAFQWACEMLAWEEKCHAKKKGVPRSLTNFCSDLDRAVAAVPYSWCFVFCCFPVCDNYILLKVAPTGSIDKGASMLPLSSATHWNMGLGDVLTYTFRNVHSTNKPLHHPYQMAQLDPTPRILLKNPALCIFCKWNYCEIYSNHIQNATINVWLCCPATTLKS